MVVSASPSVKEVAHDVNSEATPRSVPLHLVVYFYVGTLHFHFVWVRYLNEFNRILHLHKYSRILHKYNHLAHPVGVYGCYLHKLFQKRSYYFDNFLCWLVLFFIHDHSTHLCAIFVATQVQLPQ